MAQSVDRLKEAKAKSKVILLLSDGEQTFGTLSPLKGAEIAKTFGIKVYVIGIGTNGDAPYLCGLALIALYVVCVCTRFRRLP